MSAGDALAALEVCSLDDEHCITCGDVAVELTVMRFDVDRALALCEDDEGRRETVETALLESIEPGDRILVHAGTAIAPAAPTDDWPAGDRNALAPKDERPSRHHTAPGREAEEVVPH